MQRVEKLGEWKEETPDLPVSLWIVFYCLKMGAMRGELEGQKG